MDARTLCLGALELGDASGYEIKKLYEEGDLSHFYAVGFGSIYPALTRLVDDGLAECFDQPQDKRPDKKVYALTEAGRPNSTIRLSAVNEENLGYVFQALEVHETPAKYVEARTLDDVLANT